MYKKILVPLDGSKTAEIALPHAESLARQYDAELLLLSVISTPVVAARESLTVKTLQQQIDDESQEMRVYLKGLKGEFASKNIRAKAIYTIGPVVGSIIQTADAQSVDLVMIASHGRTGLKRVFFGSTAAGILNRIDQPLMVLRKPE
jgi:nucleotide-binding universal stress UspA family protein